MSQNTAFSMNELEAESAELLPARETLCRVKSHCAPSYSVSESAGAIGLVNILSGDNINVVL